MAWTGTIAMAESVEDLLYDHCLGAGDPSGYLLDHGKFPPGWMRRFDELMAAAKSCWSARDDVTPGTLRRPVLRIVLPRLPVLGLAEDQWAGWRRAD